MFITPRFETSDFRGRRCIAGRRLRLGVLALEIESGDRFGSGGTRFELWRPGVWLKMVRFTTRYDPLWPVVTWPVVVLQNHGLSCKIMDFQEEIQIFWKLYVLIQNEDFWWNKRLSVHRIKFAIDWELNKSMFEVLKNSKYANKQS